MPSARTGHLRRGAGRLVKSRVTWDVLGDTDDLTDHRKAKHRAQLSDGRYITIGCLVGKAVVSVDEIVPAINEQFQDVIGQVVTWIGLSYEIGQQLDSIHRFPRSCMLSPKGRTRFSAVQDATATENRKCTQW